MKNTNKVSKIPVFGLAAIIAAIALTLALTTCDGPNDEDDGDGTTFSSVEAFNEWLKEQPDNTPDTHYRVKLKFSNSQDLRRLEIRGWDAPRSKYIYIDLSDSTITSIPDETFTLCGILVGITIGESVTSIGKEAFSYSGLRSVIIGNGVTSIGENAFEQCQSLTSVTIGNSVTSIGENAFEMCSKLTSVTIPDSVTSIGNNAFVNSGITSLTLGNSVTSIGWGAFQNCTLTSVTIPNSVTYLNGFLSCTNLASVTIGNGVKTIGDNAFQGCSSLTSIIIPSSVTSIGHGAFYNESSYPNRKIGLTSVTFEGTIPSSGFATPTAITNEPFPGDLKTKFYATDSANGTPGTYTRPDNNSGTWTLQ